MKNYGFQPFQVCHFEIVSISITGRQNYSSLAGRIVHHHHLLLLQPAKRCNVLHVVFKIATNIVRKFFEDSPFDLHIECNWDLPPALIAGKTEGAECACCLDAIWQCTCTC